MHNDFTAAIYKAAIAYINQAHPAKSTWIEAEIIGRRFVDGGARIEALVKVSFEEEGRGLVTVDVPVRAEAVFVNAIVADNSTRENRRSR